MHSITSLTCYGRAAKLSPCVYFESRRKHVRNRENGRQAVQGCRRGQAQHRELDAEVGATVELPVICFVDGSTVEADPAKAAAKKVTAEVVEQFKGPKQLVFKFKKRKNYKKLRGHRQQLTRVEIKSIA